MPEPVITIFGTRKATPGDKYYDLAFQLGKKLAENGFTIANGGYTGTMLAAAKGASTNNGKVIGVTCALFKGKANQFVTDQIVAQNLDDRLKKLIDLGDAYIILPGGTGTLLELAMVWELKNKNILNNNKPILLLNSFYDPLIDLMASQDPDAANCITKFTDPDQAINFLTNQLTSTGNKK
jgi:hypothetical protein